jgi:hypothetical protein
MPGRFAGSFLLERVAIVVDVPRIARRCGKPIRIEVRL